MGPVHVAQSISGSATEGMKTWKSWRKVLPSLDNHNNSHCMISGCSAVSYHA